MCLFGLIIIIQRAVAVAEVEQWFALFGKQIEIGNLENHVHRCLQMFRAPALLRPLLSTREEWYRRLNSRKLCKLIF